MNPLESSHVMFVLGAGAWVPLGMPTTVSLMQRLEGGTRLGRLAAEVHKSAAYRFRVPAASINIEDFFEQLYEIQLLLWLAGRTELPTLLPGFTANAPVLDDAGRDAAALQQRAYRLLHRLCGDCSGARVHKLWQPILEFAATQQPVVPIFTLNYDWTFEKLAIENAGRYHLTDGFELLGGTWDGQRFDRLRPSRSKINLALFKLHGSTCWLPEGPVKSMGRFEVRTANGRARRAFSARTVGSPPCSPFAGPDVGNQGREKGRRDTRTDGTEDRATAGESAL